MDTTSPCRLLLVDDDPHQLKLYKLALEQHGFHVITARDGQEGFDLASKIPFDGVVSDVLMPNVDGFRFCQMLKHDPRFADLPVVLLSSAYTESEDFRLAKDVRANALIARTADICWTVDRILHGLRTAPLPGPLHPEAKETYQRRLIRQLERQAKAAQDYAQKIDDLRLQAEDMQRTLDAQSHGLKQCFIDEK